MNEFLLSDESVNSYGFRVLTDGIDTSRFEKNPVMFYNHNREMGVIGKWTNIRKSDKKLFATPVFDEKDDFGRKLSGKVQDGFIKAASIGIELDYYNDKADNPVVKSCTLIEASICDVPSNQNALVLYVDDKPVKDKNNILKLCKLKISSDMNEELKQIIKALGLPENAAVSDIIKAINTLKGESEPENAVNEALSMKLIKNEEFDNMLALAKSNPCAFRSYIDKSKERIGKEQREKGSVILRAAILDAGLDAGTKSKDFWLKNFETDFEATKTVIEGLPKRLRISDMIVGGNDHSKGMDRSKWTLNDYRKRAPKELRDNPELYQRLLNEEKN